MLTAFEADALHIVFGGVALFLLGLCLYVGIRWFLRPLEPRPNVYKVRK